MSIPAAAMYNDIQGLAGLRANARTAPGENTQEVAAQFESLFFQMMLKSMRDASMDGGLFDSSQLDTYQQMFDQQLSLDLSRNGGLGLAEILVDQLGQQPTAAPDSGQTQSAGTGGLTRLDIERQVRSLTSVRATPAPLTTGTRPSAPAGDAGNWQPASPEEFVNSVWQHAVDAAAELGVDPAVLVAQSALETGWGKKVIRAADGSSSLNLFGIKAGGDWNGSSATVNTLEYRDGVAAMETARFRTYDSLSAAFKDYVGLLRDNPRYQSALDNAGDGPSFLKGLQSAGYATDPGYADKIMGILGGTNYANMVQALKNSANPSLSG